MKRLALIPVCVVGLALAATAFADVGSGTPKQRSVLAGALRSLKARGVSVEVSERLATAAHGQQRELIFSGASDPASQWKAEVAAGVFAARGIGLTWISIPGHGTMRYNRVAGLFDPATSSDIIRAIKSAAHVAGVRVGRIELLRPLAFAPVVTITVPDRARFVHSGGLHVAALLNYQKPRVEGIFLIARDAKGHVWSRGGSAIRLGTGAGTWPGSTHG